MNTTLATSSTVPPQDGRQLKILAKSVYRELRNSGYDSSSIVSFTNELLELITDDLREKD